jgi:hypothetical protein
MYPRAWWAMFLVIGSVVAFFWPFLTGVPSPIYEGLVSVAAWLIGLGGVYAIVRWAGSSRPVDHRPDGEPR